MAYRVPRRFIVPPDEPPPYGLLLLSFVGHAFFFLMAGALSAYVNAQIDQSKIYIVNLVPAEAPLGSPAPRVVEAPRDAPRKAEVRTPPRPEKLEAPRPKETPPPKPEKAPEKAELPPPPRPKEQPVKELPPPAPPRPLEVARAVPPRPAELALPRRAEKETPTLDTPSARERLTPLPPPPAPVTPTPPRPAEPARVTPAPAPAPAPPPLPPAVVARPGPEPLPLGRPDSTTPRTPSNISLDVSDFPFTYYLRQLQAKISERWAPPRSAAAGGERAIVVFEIGRDGQIKEPSVEKTSGNAIYDQSALRAVMEASPFPPLPPEFRAPSLRVHFGFEFRPEQG
jgi:TonB family protein